MKHINILDKSDKGWFAWTFITISVSVLTLLLPLAFSSCGSGKPCSSRNEAKAQRLLDKSVLKCDRPFVELSTKRFDNTVYVHDSSWIDKLVPVYDTCFIGDTVLVVKTDTKVLYRQVTKQIENKAKIEQLTGELARLNVANTDLNATISVKEGMYKEEKSSKNIWMARFIGLSLLIGLGILAKIYLKPKFL